MLPVDNTYYLHSWWDRPYHYLRPWWVVRSLPLSADCWCWTEQTLVLVLRCGRSLTLLWPKCDRGSCPEMWPTFDLDMTPVWPWLLSWDVATLLAVKHSERLSNFLLRVCAVDLLGHHVEELREVYRAATYTYIHRHHSRCRDVTSSSQSCNQ